MVTAAREGDDGRTLALVVKGVEELLARPG
jgi:hypothetical protein